MYPGRLAIFFAGFAASMTLAVSALAVGGYLDTLDYGAPSAPAAIDPADLRVSVHYDQNPYNGTAFPAFLADHGPGCEAPPAQHAIHLFSDAYFVCHNHIMTAVFGQGGYGEIAMQPNQLVDFTNGSATLDWSVSTEKDSLRDWWQVDVSKFGDDVQLPADVAVDLAGQPRNGIFFKIDNTLCPGALFNGQATSCGPKNSGTVFDGKVYQNGTGTDLPRGDTLESYVPQSEAIRTRFEIQISKTHVKFGLPAVPGKAAPVWLSDQDLPNGGFDWSQGVVTLSHHSYNPTKDGSGQPGTWHWSDIGFSPAVPYTVIKANEAYADLTSGPMGFSFPQAAPANSVVTWQQDSNGGDQASFDRGATWQNAAQQSTTQAPVGNDKAKQFRAPIPQGATGFLVRATGGGAAGGNPYARDAAVVGPPCASSCTPAAATSTATPTRTSAPPTSSPAPPTSTPTGTPSRGTGPGHVATSSGAWYLHGANMPWLNFGADFGGGSGGVSNPANTAALDAKLRAAQAAGMHVVRWWLFEGGASMIQTDGSGAPASVNPAVYPDIDAALQLAAKYDISYDLVLFASPTDINTTWETDSAKRAALGSALAPLFAHYAGNTHVLAWEIVNEPDWDINAGKIDLASVQATVDTIADAVHANSPAGVTVGTAYLSALPRWVGHHLDFYTAHYYSNPAPDCALCTDYPSLKSAYGLDKPLVIGESYNAPDVAAQQQFQYYYDHGFAGDWPWSLSPEKTNDHFAIDMNAAAAFAAGKSDLGPRSQVTPPATATPVQPTPTPMATATATPGGSKHTVLLGDNAVEATADGLAQGTAEGYQYTATARGTAQLISVYLLNAPPTDVRLGLYSNKGNSPGRLLASCAVSNGVANAWNGCQLSSAVPISRGTKYWIAILGANGPVTFEDKNDGTSLWQDHNTTVAVLPNAWAPGGGGQGYKMSAYVTT